MELSDFKLGVFRKMVLVLGLACAAHGARAESLLFWFIGEDAPAFDYAKLMIGAMEDGVFTGNGYATNIGVGWSESDEYVYDERPDWPPSVQAAVLSGDYSELSFIVELYNAESALTHTSAIYNIDDLAEYITDRGFGAGWQYIEPLQVFPFYDAVPEPSSGMLVLIGAAALALRRRRWFLVDGLRRHEDE